MATAAIGRRQDGVVCETVCAAAAEHKGVNAHSHVLPLRLDALPNKHAGAVQAVYRAWLWADLVACNNRTVVSYLGVGSYTCTPVECLVARKVVLDTTVTGIGEENWKDLPVSPG